MRIWPARTKGTPQTDDWVLSLYELWDATTAFAAEIRASDFMIEMMRRRAAHGSHGLMAALDCATLYALTRWHRPTVVVESGGFVGLSAAFILKALADGEAGEAKLYSIEMDDRCEAWALVPKELRARLVPVRARIEEALRRDKLPTQIDMFFHDSGHTHRHMMWEFRQFWPRLRPGGLLLSHDVHMNAAFAKFVAETYAEEKRTGLLNRERTKHEEWGRWGYIGFLIKKAERASD
jgi:predicted O-methyltransferase YrrM